MVARLGSLPPVCLVVRVANNAGAPCTQARKRDAAAVQEQLQEIRHSMALDPPAESPFADVLCLDGLLQLVGEA